MSHLKRITKVIVNALTCLLLCLLVLVVYGKVVLTFKHTYPNYFGYTFFEVASGSMEPTLRVNDVILVKITNEDLKTGDIIAFLNEDTIITHRIIYIEGETLTVKGDNNNIVDKPIDIRQVIGKIVKVYPRLGIWKKVVTEPKILLAVFITLLLFDFALSYNIKGDDNFKDDDDDDEMKVKKVKKPVKIKKEVKEPEEPIAKQIMPEEKVVSKPKKPVKDITEADKLLEMTRKIDIDEINKLLEGTEYKLEKKEINHIKKKIEKIEDNKKEQVEENKDKDINLSPKEKKFIEYTMRLDLSEIQRKINSKVK